MELDPAYAMSFIGGAEGPTSIFIGHGRLGVIGPIVLLAVILVLLGLVIFALVRSIMKQNKACTIIFSVLTCIFALILAVGAILGIRQFKLQKEFKEYMYSLQQVQDNYNEYIDGQQKDEPESATRLIRGKHVKEDYPSSLTWNGTNAQPILDTDSKKNYRTIITEASQLPPDFNGKYKIASFGAGTMANGSFIINLETGVVTEGPGFEYSLDYSINSNLIIRNPKEDILNFWKDELGEDEEIPLWSITEYYLFEDDQLTMIDSGYEF